MKILFVCFAIACVFLLIESAPQQKTTKKPDSSSESFEKADTVMRSSKFLTFLNFKGDLSVPIGRCANSTNQQAPPPIANFWDNVHRYR